MSPSINRRARRPKQVPVTVAKTPDPVLLLARRLDRLADAELFFGHHGAAEHLARRAAEMRGATQ